MTVTNVFCVNCGMPLMGDDRFCDECLEHSIGVPYLRCWGCSQFEWGAPSYDLPVGNCRLVEFCEKEEGVVWEPFREPTFWELSEALHSLYQFHPQWDLMRNIYAHRCMAALMGWPDTARSLETEICSCLGRHAMVSRTGSEDPRDHDYAPEGDVVYLSGEQLWVNEVIQRVPPGADLYDSIFRQYPTEHELVIIRREHIGTVEYREPTTAVRADSLYKNWKRRNKRQWRQMRRTAFIMAEEMPANSTPTVRLVEQLRRQMFLGAAPHLDLTPLDLAEGFAFNRERS